MFTYMQGSNSMMCALFSLLPCFSRPLWISDDLCRCCVACSTQALRPDEPLCHPGCLQVMHVNRLIQQRNLQSTHAEQAQAVSAAYRAGMFPPQQIWLIFCNANCANQLSAGDAHYPP